MEAALCSRKRPSRGAVLHPHQEAQQGHKRRTGGSKENRDPTEVLQRNRTTQRRLSQIRTRTRTRTMCWAASGFRSGAEIQSCRPEVRVALIQKTKIQNSVQDLVQLRRSNLDHKYRTEPEPTETLLDHRGPTRDRQTITTFEIRSRSRSRSGPQRPEGLVSYQSTESRTRTSRSKIVLGPESCRGDGRPLKSRTRRTEARTKRRTKIHPSAFRGRGQLRLSITAEAGQLIVHIHEAKGLMGTSCRSCDSYVKVDVASEQHHKITMRTGMVSNSKNPKYRRCFTLCIRDELLLSRLLVSVFSRSPDSRRSQLIGCMSFGIASLVSSSQLLTGWFYLLGEEYGRSKHLRVTSERSGPMRSAEEKVALKADLRKTPDSTPEPDLNRTNSTTEPKDPTNHCLTNSNYSSYRSTLFANSNQRHGNRDTRLTVSVIRGKDGFGFTICSDCPVRVQAVDPGGPAHQSGLHQGDSVLQLNGLPVETWKCVDLAHAIRNCPSQIVLVVWRGLPELRSCDTMLRPPTHNMMTGRKLLSHPSHSKHGHRRGQGSGVRSSLVALGSLWRDRKEVCEEDQEQEATEFSPHTTTLKGTRVTSSNGDNYIILSPINSGEQVLQPVYHNRNGTIGRLYQTHPSRGQNLLHDPRTASSQRPFTSHTSTLPPPTSSSSALSSNYGNYQNCTIVQSHLPCSGYGTYVTLAPKTLIFPIFVQPLDLCSPERTLLLSEEMVLHQADLLPAKVTVLIYSDLLLLTREDEAGRCNVLQSPVYLNTLQLRDVPSEPLYIYLLQNSQSCCRLLFSLEAFSIEQKVRVSLCLHDNMPLQLVTTETGHTQQLPDLQSDFGLLSLYSPPCSPLCDATPLNPLPLYPSSSPCFRNNPPPPSSPLWKEQGGLEEEEEKEGRKRRREEEEERQQGEGESASETSEHVGGVWGRGLLLGTTHFNMKEEESDDEDDDEEEELRCRAAGLRRSFSEGSLLQEPRSPRFLSDSTIHRLTRPVTFDPDSCSVPQPPSPRTLRSQLTREGGSLHHMLLLLNGTKADDSRNCQLRKKTKILAADVRSRLTFLRKWKSNSTSYHGNSLEKALRNTRPSAGEVLSWAESLEALLTNQYGLTVFRHFLRSEFSEENLDFWLTVEKFKKTRPFSKMATRAAKIYDEFISTSASRQVNVDSSVRELTNQSLCLGVRPTSFQLAQDQIFALMETDSYPRFLKSRFYAQLINHNTHTAS